MTQVADSSVDDRRAVEVDGSIAPGRGRALLAGLLVATTAFWSIGLGRNGWANAFYAAAVQAGTKSWKAFLFGSSDAANAITVDKPPAALWPMVLSARIFGVNTWSILLPQVLLGVASVWLMYVIVSKRFGPIAGLISGLTLAVTPVATLMFRFDNPDALLVFLMVAAVWAMLRAVDSGHTRWLVMCGVLVGLGFLTKQLQVMLVVPGLALTYLIAGPPRLRVRLAQLMAALAAMVVSAGWWVLLVEVWPKDQRPYIGGSRHNSFLELTFGYNGFGRIMGGDKNFPGGPPPGLPGGPPPGLPGGPPPGLPDGPPGGFSPFGHAGLTRMFTGESGAQISWLLPAAVLLLAVGLVARGRRTRTDLDRAHYLVWGGWLIGTAAVFSFMSGLFHDYYTVALAPAVAALVGMGVVELWRRRTAWTTTTLAAVIAVTGVWAFVLLSRTPEFVPWLRWAVVAGAVVAAAAFVLAAFRPSTSSAVRTSAAAVGIAAALAGPLAYSIQTVGTAHTGGVVAAGPQVPGGFPGPGPAGDDDARVPAAVVERLQLNSATHTWAAAVPGSTEAAYYQLASDQPVMALGGFGSGDPAPTLEQFQTYVAEGRVHYYLPSIGLGMPKFPGRAGMPPPKPPGMNGDSEAERIGIWVKQHYTPVTVDGVPMYDLTQPARTNA